MTASTNPDRATLDRLRDLLREAQTKPLGSRAQLFARIAGLGLNVDTIDQSPDALVVLCVAAHRHVRRDANMQDHPYLTVAVMHDGRCLALDDMPSDKPGEALARRWLNHRAAQTDKAALEQDLRSLITLQERMAGRLTDIKLLDASSADPSAILAARNHTLRAIDERIARLTRHIHRLADREEGSLAQSTRH